jgi:predicted Co/Zn/Cd cation transporter (cation efflux family)
MADPLGYQLGKWVVIAGAALVAAGLLLMGIARFGFLHFGRLPGDIAYKGKNVSFYFPVATCLVISLVITAIVWLISYLRRP